MIKKDGFCEISIYNDELTKECIAKENVKLMTAFPALEPGFFKVFSDRIKANNYTDQRLKDAIGYVIDNCVYPTPTIAQFISFDKRIKLYSYDDVLKINEISNTAFQTHRPVRIGNLDRPMYATINDIEEYKLKQWEL